MNVQILKEFIIEQLKLSNINKARFLNEDPIKNIENETIKNYYVYILFCPIENVVRYIGISKNPEERYITHLSNRQDNLHKTAWIKKIELLEVKPELIIISEILTVNEAANIEYELIKFSKQFSDKITNMCDGGGIPPSSFGRAL